MSMHLLVVREKVSMTNSTRLIGLIMTAALWAAGASAQDLPAPGSSDLPVPGADLPCLVLPTDR